MSWWKTSLGHVMVALLLTLGLAVTWSYLLISVTEAVSWRSRPSGSTYEQLAIREDGVPLVVGDDLEQGHQARHLDGTIAQTDPPQGQLAGAYLFPPRATVARWADRVVTCSPTWWYFVHTGRADGQGYFVGFDPKSKQRIGFIGLCGFQTGEPSDEEKIPFDGAGGFHSQMVYPHGYLAAGLPPSAYGFRYGGDSPYLFLISSGRLLRVDLLQRSIKVTYEQGDLISVAVRNVNVSMLPAGPVTTVAPGTRLPPVRHILDAARTDELALRTDNALLFADSQGTVTARFALPQELQQELFTAYLLNDQQCLLTTGRTGQHELIWLNRDGTTARRQKVSLASSIWLPPTGRSLFQAAAFPVPVAFGAQLAFSYASDAPRPIYTEGPPMRWLAFALLLLISIPLAYLCFRRQRRHGLGAAWGWTLFVFLLGIPGYLGYRFHGVWPTLDRCHHCQLLIPVRGDQCPHCREAFPEPERTGVEIFA